MVGALIFDTVMVFLNLQNADTGEFDITGLTSVSWSTLMLVTGIALIIAAVLFGLANKDKKNRQAV